MMNNQQSQPQPRGVTIRGRRIPLWGVIGGVVLTLAVISCACCGAVGVLGSLGSNSGQAQAQATATTDAGLPAALATDTPAPPTGKHVLHISGASQAVTSKTFTVHNSWVITWGCTPGLGNDLLVMVNDPSGTVASSDIPTIRYTCPANGGAGSQDYHASGTFTLSVSGGATWDIVVLDVLD